MICLKCDGRGFKLLMNRFCDLYTEVCDKCGGSGVVEPMTNEEYIRSCTFEELAEILTKAILDEKRFRMTVVGGVSETKHWLKEIRK